MPNRVVVVPIAQEYPFGASSEWQQARTTVQACKRVAHGIEPRFVMKEKIRLLKNLGFQHLVGLESTSEEESFINLTFEYVPLAYTPAARPAPDELADRVRASLLELADSLANHFVDHEFKLANVGLDRKQTLKYFLGFNFKIDRSLCKQATAQKYRAQVESFFKGAAQTRPRESCSRNEEKNCYGDTMDTTWKGAPHLAVEDRGRMPDCRLTVPTNSQLALPEERGRLMKKSTCAETGPRIELETPKRSENRFTFNYDNQIRIPVQEKQFYDSQRTGEIKVVKMEELGARINRLKDYMREVTGKTPTSSAGLSHMTVRIDGSNADNRIYTQDNITITPSYTQLEKKIAEFRESKLHRAYNEKEILYSQNNQGFQLHSTQQIRDSRNPALSKPPPQQPEIRNSRLPNNDKDNDPRTSHLKSKNSLDSSTNFAIGDDRQHKQYIQLASNDKYCEQFLYFLEDQNPVLGNGGQSTNSLASQQERDMVSRENSEYSSSKRARGSTSENLHTQSSESAWEIQNRVKKAIRNSMKLISGLKARETIRCE